MASEPKMGDVRNMSSVNATAEVFAGHEFGWVFCNLKGACRLLAGLIGREREAAREMREVLREVGSGVIVSPASVRLLDCCPLCQGPRVTHHREEGKVHSKIGHAPDCRLARLIGGGE